MSSCVINSGCCPPLCRKTYKILQINILYACMYCTTALFDIPDEWHLTQSLSLTTLSLSTAAYITYSCRPAPLFALVHTIALYVRLVATAHCFTLALQKLTHANVTLVAETWLHMCSVVFFTYAYSCVSSVFNPFLICQHSDSLLESNALILLLLLCFL